MPHLKRPRPRWLCFIVLPGLASAVFSLAGEAKAKPAEDTKSSCSRAVEFLEKGKRREAAAEMVRVLESLPASTPAGTRPGPNAETHYRSGIAHLRVRRDALAEKEFRLALEMDPADSAARYQIAFLLGNRGDYAGMFEQLCVAGRDGSLKAEKLRAMAGLALISGNSEDAIKFYREALAVNPSSPELMRMLGIILVEDKKEDEGFALMGKALAVQPNDYSNLSALGLASALSGDYTKAEDYLNRAIKINGDHPEALGRLGLVYVLQGRLNDGVQKLTEAVKLNPSVAELHFNLAKAYKLQGSMEKADEQYTLALKLEPDNCEGWYEKSDILGSQGKADRALEAYRKVVELEPNFAGAHYRIGLLLARKKKYSEAEAAFKRTIRANCDYADAYYALAVISSENDKDKREAAHYYMMYLLYDSSSERAREAAKWLEMNKKREPGAADKIPNPPSATVLSKKQLETFGGTGKSSGLRSPASRDAGGQIPKNKEQKTQTKDQKSGVKEDKSKTKNRKQKARSE